MIKQKEKTDLTSLAKFFNFFEEGGDQSKLHTMKVCEYLITSDATCLQSSNLHSKILDIYTSNNITITNTGGMKIGMCNIMSCFHFIISAKSP